MNHQKDLNHQIEKTQLISAGEGADFYDDQQKVKKLDRCEWL